MKVLNEGVRRHGPLSHKDIFGKTAHPINCSFEKWSAKYSKAWEGKTTLLEGKYKPTMPEQGKGLCCKWHAYGYSLSFLLLVVMFFSDCSPGRQPSAAAMLSAWLPACKSLFVPKARFHDHRLPVQSSPVYRKILLHPDKSRKLPHRYWHPERSLKTVIPSHNTLPLLWGFRYIDMVNKIQHSSGLLRHCWGVKKSRRPECRSSARLLSLFQTTPEPLRHQRLFQVVFDFNL